MTEPSTDGATTNAHEVEITDHGHTLPAAELNAPADPHGAAHVVLHRESGQLPTRAHLVHGVLDSREVESVYHLQAYAPIGHSESMARIRQRSTDMRTHAAGWTSIIAADLTAVGDCAEPVVLS